MSKTSTLQGNGATATSTDSIATLFSFVLLPHSKGLKGNQCLVTIWCVTCKTAEGLERLILTLAPSNLSYVDLILKRWCYYESFTYAEYFIKAFLTYNYEPEPKALTQDNQSMTRPICLPPPVLSSPSSLQKRTDATLPSRWWERMEIKGEITMAGCSGLEEREESYRQCTFSLWVLIKLDMIWNTKRGESGKTNSTEYTTSLHLSSFAENRYKAH